MRQERIDRHRDIPALLEGPQFVEELDEDHDEL